MRFAAIRVLGAVLVCLAVVRGEGMSIDDLINLKKAGFSEKEIQAEVEKATAAPKVDAANAARLKAAGFSDAFLAKLRTAGGGLTLDTIREMHKGGKSATVILQALARSTDRPSLSTPEALDLTRAGVPAIVVRALRGGAVDADEMLRLAKSGTSGDELAALLDVVGTKGKPTAAQALDLMRAGVPDRIVKRLRSGGGASITKSADGKARFEHPSGRFSLSYPSGWRHLLNVQKEDVVLEFVFTPDQTEADPEKLGTGLSVVPIHLTPGTMFATATLDDLVKMTLPAILSEEPGLKVHGDTKSGRLAGTDARFIELRGTMKARGKEILRLTSAVMRKDGILCFVSAWAPLAQYEKYSDTFGKCADSLEFGNPPAYSNRRATTSQEFVERYRGSVVQVATEKGTGTGFIVRKDGYVLTNHHVVFDKKTGKLIKEFTLHFDVSLKRRPLRAVLVGAKRGADGQSLMNLAGAGVDIALLKITDPGTFEPLPITPLSNVKLSDPVVTMGFPYSSVLGGNERLSMFVTRGVVVRFNKDLWGQTEGLFIDAKITHGNSGGPCIDLASGGVIGLNTWGFNIGSDVVSEEVTNNLVGYNGVVPIDAALREWPDVLRLTQEREERLSTEDRLILAVDYHGQGLFGAAERQAKEVVEARPDFADARVLLAACALQLGKFKEFSDHIDSALVADPNHYSALIFKAQVHAQMEEFAKAAIVAERAIKSRPDSPVPYLARGALYLTVKRFDDALADADKAAELAEGMSSDPELLAAQALYALEKLDKGRARYQKALVITPGRFEALMGAAEYFERKKMYEAALLEYGKVAAVAPLQPIPEEAIGRCHVELKHFKRARDAYMKAFTTYMKHAQRPPEEVFERLAAIHTELGEVEQIGKATIGRSNAYPESIAGHVALARMHQKLGKAPALAFGHAITAVNLSEGAAEVREAIKGIPPAAISLDDIALMDKLNYRMSGLAVLSFAPTSFRISEELVKGIKKITPFTMRALQIIATRQDKGDKAIGVGGGGRDTPKPPANNGQTRTWTSVDKSFVVSVPASFAPQVKRVEGAQNNNLKFLHFVCASEQDAAEILLWVFPANVNTFAAAHQEIGRYAKALGMQYKVTPGKRVTWGEKSIPAGQFFTGTLSNANGSVECESLLINTTAGMRGGWVLSYKGGIQRIAAIRKAVFQSFSVQNVAPEGGGNAPPAPDNPTGTARDWTAPDKSLTVAIPAGFQTDAATLKRARDNNIDWVPFAATSQAQACEILLWTFPKDVRSYTAAFQKLLAFAQMYGANLKIKHGRKVVFGQAKIAAGQYFTGTFENGEKKFPFEILLVASSNGMRGGWVLSYKDGIERLAALRKAVFASFRVAGVVAAEAGGGGGQQPDPGGGGRWSAPDKSMTITFPPGFKLKTRFDNLAPKNQFIKLLANHDNGMAVMAWAFAPDVTIQQALDSYVRFMREGKLKAEVKGNADIKGGTQKLIHGVYTGSNNVVYKWVAVFGGSRLGGRAVYIVSPDAQMDDHLKLRNALINSFETGVDRKPGPGGGDVPAPGGDIPAPGGDVPAPPGGDRPGPGGKTIPEDDIPGPGEDPNRPPVKTDPIPNNAGPSWTSADRTFTVPLPTGYTRNAERERLVRQNNFGWVAMIAENKQLRCDFSGFVFPKNVQSFEECETMIDRYMTANQVELVLEKRVPIQFGNRKALHVWGTGGNQQMRFAWETIIVLTEHGARGFWMQAYGAGRDRFKQQRDHVVSRMKIGGAGGGGAPAAGNVAIWKDPQGRMSVSYPRSYQVNQQAVQNYANNGINFLPLLAVDAQARSDFFVTAFGPQVRTVEQALVVLVKFEAGANATLTATGMQDFKVGQLTGKLVSGKLTFPNGQFMQWEGVFVPTQNGVRGVAFFCQANTWKQTFEHRKTLFTSLKVIR